LLPSGLGIQAFFYNVVGFLVAGAGGAGGGALSGAVFLAGRGQNIAFPRLPATVPGGATGERAYRNAVSVTQWTPAAGLFPVILIAIPARRRLNVA